MELPWLQCYIDDFHFKRIANSVIEIDNVATITAMLGMLCYIAYVT